MAPVWLHDQYCYELGLKSRPEHVQLSLCDLAHTLSVVLQARVYSRAFQSAHSPSFSSEENEFDVDLSKPHASYQYIKPACKAPSNHPFYHT